MFLLKFTDAWVANVDVGKVSEAMKWDRRFKHVNHHNLKLLKSKELVTGLVVIGELGACDE